MSSYRTSLWFRDPSDLVNEPSSPSPGTIVSTTGQFKHRSQRDTFCRASKTNTRCKRSIHSTIPVVVLFCIVFLSSWTSTSTLQAEATDIKWTPNEEPKAPEYSMQERQMLMQLDQHISSSANPQETLQQLAEANQLPPQELVDILMENRQFMAEHGGGPSSIAGRRPLTIAAIQTVASAVSRAKQFALQNPRKASALLSMSVVSLYIGWNAPRNGVMLGSSGRGRGPSSMFVPPQDYLEETLLEQDWWESPTAPSTSAHQDESYVWKEIEKAMKSKKKANRNDHQVRWHSNLGKGRKGDKKGIQKAAIIERAVDLSGIIPDNKDDSNAEEGDDQLSTTDILQDLFLDQTKRLLYLNPQLTEFASDKNRIRFILSETGDFAILIVPGLGRMGTVGFVPLVIHWDTEDDDEEIESSGAVASIVLSTLPGTFWEGQDIYIRVLQGKTKGVSKRNRAQQSSLETVVQVAMTKSHKAMSFPKKLVNSIVDTICTSVQSSLETRTKQAWVRQGQSARFKGRAKQAAQNRRKTRASLERQLEEMATDRRRRRFQKNPDQGRYRPSGDRMRSPSGGPAFSF